MKFVLLLLILLILTIPLPVRASTGSSTMVVLLLPGTSLEQWQTHAGPNLRHLMKTGALGLMNTRTARLPNDHSRETPESALLTIGSGARMAGGDEITDYVLASSRSVKFPSVTAGDLYRRRTGLLPDKSELVAQRWADIVRANSHLGYMARPGNLGDALAKLGIPSFAYGKICFPILTTSLGTVHGQADRVKSMDSIVVKPGLTIYDLGDDLTLADNAISKITKLVSQVHGRLFALSPYPSDTDYRRNSRLSPILEWGPGIVSGLLYSQTTRRPGLAANIDIASTITAYFCHGRTDSLPSSPFGGVITAAASPNNISQLRSIETQALCQYSGMRILPFVGIGIACIILITTFLKWTQFRRNLFGTLVICIVLALLISKSPYEFALVLVISQMICFVVVRFVSASALSLGIGIFIQIILLADLMTGNSLMRQSLLGYSVIEGARYYGIGNEAMGALIGATILTTSRLWNVSRYSHTVLIVLLAITIVLLGSSFAGAKAGGILVSVISFSMLLTNLFGRKITLSVFLTMIALSIIILVLFTAAELFRHSSESHIGRAAILIAKSHDALQDIAVRKLSVTIHLLSHSAWALPLFAGIIAIMRHKTPAADVPLPGFALKMSGITAVLCSVAVNDAGVVAGAICAAIIWGGLACGGKQASPAADKCVLPLPQAISST